MAVVFGNPDQVHRRAGETRVLEKHGEHARAAEAFESAQIGHGDAAAGEDDVGQRRLAATRASRGSTGPNGDIHRNGLRGLTRFSS